MNLDTLYADAIAGDADAIAKLEEEADILNKDGKTILHVELERGNTERVKFILRQFPNRNLLVQLRKNKQTALHLASYYGYTEVVEVLIEAARHLPSSSANDDNPVTSFQAFLRQGDYHGDTALHMASYYGHTEVAKVLIEAARHYLPSSAYDDDTLDSPVTSFQAFLRQGDDDGDTALHCAAVPGHVDIVKLLVEADPTDRHTQNNDGKTPTYIAAERGRNDIVEIICTTCTAPSLDGPHCSTVVRIDNLDQVKSPGGTLYKIKDIYDFYDAAIAGDAHAIAKLEMEADKLYYSDNTILHMESGLGKTECVRFLLKEFANKNLLVKLNRCKETALHLAVYAEHTEVAEVLIEAARHLPSSSANPVTSFQAFLRQGDEDGNTALHLAADYGHVDIVKLLVEADADDRHIKNNDGETPIYLAAESGYYDIVKLICTTCTAPSLDGPGRSTALHAAISNIDEVKEENRDVIIRLLIEQAKKQRTYKAFFDGIEEDGLSLLELAAGKNDLDVVKLLLESDPAYVRGNKKNSLMRSIYISDEKNNSDMVQLLSEKYEVGKIGVHKGKTKGVVSLILAIRKHDKDEIRRRLEAAPRLVHFAEDEGWTPLHYVAYHNFDFILDVFIKAQIKVEHPFKYGDMVSTPFHVAAEEGNTSMLIRLMQLWPQSSPAAYTAVNNIGQNILHIAADKKNKDMIQGIWKQCPQTDKDTMFKRQDADGNTFLHLLFLHGCFIPELIKLEGLVTITKNNDNRTPRDMLYFSDDVIADQAKIKFALDDEAQTNQSRIFWWRSPKKKMEISEHRVDAKKREAKDLKFDEKKQSWKAEKHSQLEKEKKENLGKYKERTNTQIIVCALITTVTFTVGFTMPGGLRQSEQVGEGLVVLSKKAAFHAFMLSDAIALLLSTSSLFFYFLGSMGEDHHQVAKLPLGAASTVFNIASIIAMMFTFIAGTYVVLSHSPALAITVCVIGSLFFLLLIVLLIKIVCDRPVKWYEDSAYMPAGLKSVMKIEAHEVMEKNQLSYMF